MTIKSHLEYVTKSNLEALEPAEAVARFALDRGQRCACCGERFEAWMGEEVHCRDCYYREVYSGPRYSEDRE